MGQAYSGQDGQVVAGSTNMDVSGFEAEVTSAEVDTTVTTDGGWSDTDGWVKTVTGSFDFFYQPSKSPLKASPGLVPGSTVELTLKCTTTDALVGNAYIQSVRITSKTKDAVRGTCRFTSKGAWTLPS